MYIRYSLDQITEIFPQANFGWLESPAFSQFAATLRSAGIEFRLVGGCVRDSLLGDLQGGLQGNLQGNLQNYDIDIATPVPPEIIAKTLRTNKLPCATYGIKHGTVTTWSAEKQDEKQYVFEITTLRRDVKTDGRHAEVAFTNQWQDDAARRDFTFNALMLDSESRVIHDYYHGIKDLQNSVVRFIGDPQARIKEDFLRILRYFRFGVYYGEKNTQNKEIYQENYTAIAANVENLSILSRERVWQEFAKILNHPRPLEVLQVMHELGVLDFCVKNPALDDLKQWLGIQTELQKKSQDNPIINELVSIVTTNRVGINLVLIMSEVLKEKYNNEEHNKEEPNTELLSKIKAQLPLTKKIMKHIELISKHINVWDKNALRDNIILLLAERYKDDNVLIMMIWLLAYKSQLKEETIIYWWRAYQDLRERFPVTHDDLRKLNFIEDKNLSQAMKFLKQRWLNKYYVENQAENVEVTDSQAISQAISQVMKEILLKSLEDYKQ